MRKHSINATLFLHRWLLLLRHHALSEPAVYDIHSLGESSQQKTECRYHPGDYFYEYYGKNVSRAACYFSIRLIPEPLCPTVRP